MKKIFLTSFYSDVANLLEDFVGEGLKGKKVTFIPTASLVEFPKFFVKISGLIVDELEVTKLSSDEIKKRITLNDYIYVSGGNTFFLLQELKRKYADKVIKEQIEKGKLYIGESAGSMILSPNIEYAKLMDNEKKTQMNNNYKALNIIDFYPVPHCDNFPFKAKAKKIMKSFNNLNLKPFNNSQAILIKGNKIEVKTIQ